MNDSTILDERLRSFIAGPDDSDWRDVLRRADALRDVSGRARAAHPRWRPALIGAIAAAAIVGVGAAVAAGLGAFDGIGAAQHAQEASDTLDPAVISQIQKQNTQLAGSTTGEIVVDSARFVRDLPGGERIYALSTTEGMLCVLVTGEPDSNMFATVGCGDPLDQSRATTIASVRPNSDVPLLTYGVAVDGVASVSFISGGVETTVPVEKNVWAYEGPSEALESLTVHYSNGSSTTLSSGKSHVAGQLGTSGSPSSHGRQVGPALDWRAAINDLMNHNRLTRTYPCNSVRAARAHVAALPHQNMRFLRVMGHYISRRC